MRHKILWLRRRQRHNRRCPVRSDGYPVGVYAGRNHLVAQHRSGSRRRLERRVFGPAQVLGLSEVAALAHLPYDEMIPGLAHASAAAVAPPPGVLAASRRQDSSGWEDDDAYF